MNGIVLSSLALLLTAVDVPGVDLTGLVSKSDGRPLPGAHVFISTAALRKGVGSLCPSCYPDCEKHAITDGQGKFVLKNLDRDLVFKVVIIAEAHRPQIVPGVDPARKSLQATLTPLPADLDPRRIVRGRVVDPKGRPIAGATVEPFGIKTAGMRWWGAMPGVDPLAVTNLKGEFVITTAEPDVALDLHVKGREHAPRICELLPSGKDQKISLQTGSWVRGRILKKGQPVAGFPLGLVQVDRSAGTFLGHVEIGTNDQGEFEFPNVAPNDDYYLYHKMSTSENRGSLAVLKVHVGKDRSIADVRDLTLEPAHRLAGRVLLSDGKPVPLGTQFMLSREQAWDHQTAALDAQGRFAFDGVPEEAVSMIVRIPGYRLSANRNRFQQTGAESLATFVDKDRLDVEINFDPEPAKPDRKTTAPASGT